jgi:hypothetical protein
MKGGPTMLAIPPCPGSDWTADERAEIRRLEQLCEASPDWSLECSHTDAGDPWCLIYDQHQRGIILHIARIDRRYVVVLPREHRSNKSTIMAVAVDFAVARLKSYRRWAS